MPRATAMMALPVLLTILTIACGLTSGQNTTGLADPTAANKSNKSEDDDEQKCKKGLILPIWEPQENLSGGDVFARALVYFFTLIYLFIGVSIVADRFMASIEVITSKEKEVTVKKPNGETQIVVVRVWNETVANLTLMALGSSAPEILLSIIEIYAKKFESGDLGPGTIVGSAAFNLFVIIAICVYVIPDGEVRKIKHLRVFFVTATWSVFAYVWMYLILAHITPGVVDIWEALLTFMFFPATVLTAYIADRRMLFYKYIRKDYRLNKRGIVVEHEGLELDKNHTSGAELKELDEEYVDDAVKEFEQNRREYISILRDLRKKHPNMDMEQLELMAREEVLNKGPKSRAFYRIQATRKLTGGGNLMKRALQAEKKEEVTEMDEVKAEDAHVIKVFFDPGHYTVMESVGDFELTVRREGGDLNQCVLVDYRTEDGSASAGSDYVAVSGSLFFGPGDTQRTFSVVVIDDDLFEEDEHFYVKLSNLRLAEPDGSAVTSHSNGSAGRRLPLPEMKLSAPFVATVMILDDDHGGIFNVAEKDIEIVESVGTYSLKIARWSGARGRVAVPFTTIEGTAKPNKDYEHCEGDVIFENNETEQYITIPIIEEDSYEKDVLFYVDLKEPRYLSVDGDSGAALDFQDKNLSELSEEEKIALLGKPKLGEATRAQIRIKESKEFKNTVDKLVQRANASFVVGTSSWKEQFIEAITVSPGDDDGDDEDNDGEEGSEDAKLPSCGDYLMHFITVFWKILFAFVPPTDVYSGYPCFVVSILGIGLLTAVIGDAASQFGCTVQLRDTVTAISIVALGTSVPDVYSGYPTFVFAILGIAVLTAFIGDTASHFGCTVGLKDTINAITFVALGTSVPELYSGYPCFLASIVSIGLLTAVIGDAASQFGCTVHLRDSVTAISIVALGTSVPDRLGGWGCFVCSVVFIGLLTAFIGDVSSHFGCTVGLLDSVTAISIVAFGTSVPDTFASKVAAVQDRYADASVGNVTGSNGVNVFLGIGIAWSIAALYHWANNSVFRVKPGNLAFSVTLFCGEAVLAIGLMLLRRHPSVGGELGGPRRTKILSAGFLFLLWVIYITMSALEAYGQITGF